MPKPNYRLVITEANHADNQFYTLGGLDFPTRRAQLEILSTVDACVHDCDSDTVCYMLDVTGPDGWSIQTDREISAETAMELLGLDSLDEVRAQAKAAAGV